MSREGYLGHGYKSQSLYSVADFRFHDVELNQAKGTL